MLFVFSRDKIPINAKNGRVRLLSSLTRERRRRLRAPAGMQTEVHPGAVSLNDYIMIVYFIRR